MPKPRWIGRVVSHCLESARKTGKFDFIDAYGKVDSFDTPCQRRWFALRRH
jgi:hypothetical protein